MLEVIRTKSPWTHERLKTLFTVVDLYTVLYTCPDKPIITLQIQRVGRMVSYALFEQYDGNKMKMVNGSEYSITIPMSENNENFANQVVCRSNITEAIIGKIRNTLGDDSYFIPLIETLEDEY